MYRICFTFPKCLRFEGQLPTGQMKKAEPGIEPPRGFLDLPPIRALNTQRPSRTSLSKDLKAFILEHGTLQKHPDLFSDPENIHKTWLSSPEHRTPASGSPSPQFQFKEHTYLLDLPPAVPPCTQQSDSHLECPHGQDLTHNFIKKVPIIFYYHLTSQNT